MNTSIAIRRKHEAAGFTLIELSAALAFIAISITFLPAVQRMREAANRQSVERVLHAAGAALVKNYQTGGKTPDSLQEVLQRAGFKASGDQISGYRLSLLEAKPNLLRLTAEPLAGVTGFETALLEVSVGFSGAHYALNFSKTPGAEEARQRMLDQAAEAGARAFGRLASLLPAVQSDAALKQTRGEANSFPRQQQTLDALRGNRGMVTFDSILDYLVMAPATTSDPSARAIFSSMADDLRTAFQPGAQGERTESLGGLTSLPAVQLTDRLLNFARLRKLTALADTADLKPVLQTALNNAEAADAQGNEAGRQQALAAYTAALKSHADRQFSWGVMSKPGQFVPFRTVEILLPLASALQ